MRNVTLCIVFCSLALAATTPTLAQDLVVCAYNVESGGADPDVVAARIAEMDDVHIWALNEVQSSSWADKFEAALDATGAEFAQHLGTTGGGDKLLIIYNDDALDLISTEELSWINIGGNVRAPLVGKFKHTATSTEFLFVVNHLYRSREDRRHTQATLLREWTEDQTLPVVMGGDFNFDWSVTNGDADHDEGYDNLTQGGTVEWVRPATLVKTQDSSFNSVLDFVFVGNGARNWAAESTIVVEAGDFPDTNQTPDHRPVRAEFSFGGAEGDDCNKAAILQKIAAIEAELEELKALIGGL